MLVVWGLALRLNIHQPFVLGTGILFPVLLCVTWFDFDHYRIPNWLSYPLIAVGLIVLSILPGRNLVEHVIGAVLGYGFIWVLNAYWRRTHGHDGIGMGDAKLLAAAGAWLGVLALPIVALVASGSALMLIMLAALISRNPVQIGQRIAFGPFIALGFWVVWVIGPLLGL